MSQVGSCPIRNSGFPIIGFSGANSRCVSTYPAVANPLTAELDYYVAHQRELVAAHKGKFVVIKGQQVIAVYDDELTAVRETSKTHEQGTFLVQKCEDGNSGYTQTFHSRVVFV